MSEEFKAELMQAKSKGLSNLNDLNGWLTFTQEQK